MISEVLYVNTNCCLQMLSNWLTHGSPGRERGGEPSEPCQAEGRGAGSIMGAMSTTLFPVPGCHGDTKMARRGLLVWRPAWSCMSEAWLPSRRAVSVCHRQVWGCPVLRSVQRGGIQPAQRPGGTRAGLSLTAGCGM